MLEIHGLFRWIVVIVSVVTIVKLALGVIQKSPFTSLDRGLTLAFSISMDIQVVLGLITLVSMLTTGFPSVALVHAFVMILALVAAHYPARWRTAADDVRFRNTLISFGVSLVLIIIGVAMVGGWSKLA